MTTIGIRKLALSIRYTWFLVCAVPVFAALFGSIRVEIRDPQGMLVPNAEVTVHSKTSDWAKKVMTDAQGQLLVEAVPIGQYTISATAPGFQNMPAKDLVVDSDTVTTVEVAMDMESVEQSVDVTGTLTAIAPDSSTTETLTGKRDIERSPDADRTGSMAMITNNVPGTYVMHDHLHSRGGHGVAWQVDGVPIPNSNLATVGSQFDPKDVDYLESQRGGYSAEFGDRSYGVFNVVPRTGFEGEKFADFYATYGSFQQTNE
jgi:outer membrane receptor protein involved in Fe transport